MVRKYNKYLSLELLTELETNAFALTMTRFLQMNQKQFFTTYLSPFAIARKWKVLYQRSSLLCVYRFNR